jgi:Zn-dependent protease with chaperone function
MSAPVPAGAAEGFLLLLDTQSFAVRALLGSLAAAGLAAVAVRCGMVRSSRARRLLVLAPVLTAGGAAVASVGEEFLPQLLVPTTGAAPADRLLDLLNVTISQRELGLLFFAYAAVTGMLVTRRLAGLLVARRVLGRATAAEDERLWAIADSLTVSMRLRTPRLVLLPACPGGAFTVGTLRPLVAVDPQLLDALDDRELEGLVAHEFAHIRRRDTLLGLVIGLFRDVTFFLPPVHLAARWLRKEQEESADDLAALHTRRPVALASSILKVWDCSRGRRGLRVTCAAIGGVRLVAADGPRPASVPLSQTAKAVAVRVERLIAAGPLMTPWRRNAEVILAALVLLAGTSAAVMVPSYLATIRHVDALSFGYLVPPPQQPTEAPAFATFRALTPDSAQAADDSVSAALSPADPVERNACPCVETRTQLEQRVGASSAPKTHGWSDEDYRPYQLSEVGADAGVPAARPLWTLSDSGQQVGFFLVTDPAS